MRFLAVFAAVIASVAPAVMAGQPVNCLDYCHPTPSDAKCPQERPAVYQKGPACFQCCEYA